MWCFMLNANVIRGKSLLKYTSEEDQLHFNIVDERLVMYF